VPSIECLSELPVETYGFQVQQSRWAKGLTQVAIKLLPTILKSDAPRKVKMEAFFHLTPNISYPLMIAVSADAAGDDRALLRVVPDAGDRSSLIIASFWSISRLRSRTQLFQKPKAFLFLPVL
jgi:hypothetical protein